jgi:hypothetical protein
MTESTLSADFEEIQIEVADFLGLKRSSSDWSSDDTARLVAIMKAGLSQFYFPPKIHDRSDPHKWSFLTPVASGSILGPYATGTVTVASGTCTLAVGTWPTWAKDNGILTIGSTEYAITTRDSDSELTVVGDDVAAGTSYSLQHDGVISLPDDFGSMACRYLTFNEDEAGPRIKLIGEGQIRTMKQGNESTGQPVYAAVRPKTSDGSTGQRWELILYPLPDDDYGVYYRYEVLPNKLTTSLYAYGSAVHTQTIMQSCIAVAELRLDGVRGNQHEQFISLLTASIEHDIQVGRVHDFGYNGDNTPDSYQRHYAENYTVTLNGTDPDDF